MPKNSYGWYCRDHGYAEYELKGDPPFARCRTCGAEMTFEWRRDQDR